jgi:hypothetical protein
MAANGLRTIRWEATHSDGVAGAEWEKEAEHSARVATDEDTPKWDHLRHAE